MEDPCIEGHVPAGFSYVHLDAPDRVFICNLDKFRALKPSNGLIDSLLTQNYLADPVKIDISIGKFTDILLEPRLSRELSLSDCEIDEFKALFGDRIKGTTYEPELL